MKLAETAPYGTGDLLFCAGDPADHFYILIKGQVKLSIGDAGHVVYLVNKAGEAFGWSSLIGRDTYSATAECLGPSNLIKLNGEKLQETLKKDSDNGMIFFKRLSMVLGNRLLQSYKMISSATLAETSISFGTGQVSASETIEI
jgi:CRP-like cAMP-binding protein